MTKKMKGRGRCSKTKRCVGLDYVLKMGGRIVSAMTVKGPPKKRTIETVVAYKPKTGPHVVFDFCPLCGAAI